MLRHHWIMAAFVLLVASVFGHSIADAQEPAVTPIAALTVTIHAAVADRMACAKGWQETGDERVRGFVVSYNAAQGASVPRFATEQQMVMALMSGGSIKSSDVALTIARQLYPAAEQFICEFAPIIGGEPAQ